MKYRPDAISIPPDDPFRDDALGLLRAGEALTHLIESGRGPAVIAVDASWGVGKSTFLDMWAASYKAYGGQVVLWNAWENDYVDDVFVSLFEEIGDQIKSRGKVASAALGHARRAANSLLKNGVPLAMRLGTAGLLSGHELEGKSLDHLLERTSADYLEAYLARKKSVAKFRDQLGKFIQSNADQRQESPLPIAMVIDELDRCRPSFSLEALETIKHLFGLDGLVFVLGVDLNQLGNAIQGAYGPNFDGKTYLRRLIDVRLSLPEPDMDKFIDSLVDRFDLRTALEVKTRNWLSTPENVANSLKQFSRLYRLSLRDIEQAIFQMNLYLGAAPSNTVLYPTVAAFLIALRQKHPSRYEEFFSLANNFDDTWEWLVSMNRGIERLSSDTGYLLELELRVVIGGVSLLEERLKHLYDQKSGPSGLDHSDARILDLAGHMMKMFSNFAVSGNSVKYVRNRIELFDGLNG